MKVDQKPRSSYWVEILLVLVFLLLVGVFVFLSQTRRIAGAPGMFFGNDEADLPEIVYDLERSGKSVAAAEKVELQDELLDSEPESTGRLLSTRLFFVVFNEIGQLESRGVLREIPFRSAPLTRTVEGLLDGPNIRDINQGVHTMIPEASQLLNSSLLDGVAILDFNEAFFQNIDVASVRWAQLRQVVFTATEFEGVEAVRFLRQGQALTTWGEIKLEPPLYRQNFF